MQAQTEVRTDVRDMEGINRWRGAGLTLVLAWFTIGGLAHFIWPGHLAEAIPPALPWREAAVYITGFFELVGAAGVALSRFRRAAGLGLVALTLCITPASVYMWVYAERFATIPEGLLLLRLPLQVVLIALIWWVTQPRMLTPEDARG